jgi:hypothetical protein
MSNRQKKFLTNGLKRLGLRSYRQYLFSDDWAATRERYQSSGRLQVCAVCHDPNVDLHHRTYQRLGQENLTDLVPLCRLHHNTLHDQGLDMFTGAGILHDREMVLRRERDTRPPRGLDE